MNTILKERKVVIFYYILILFLGVYFLSIIDHGDEILFFSRNHNEFWNKFFIYSTKLAEFPVYSFIIIICLFFRFAYSLNVFLLAIIVMFLQWVLKNIFLQPRPYNFFNDQGKIEMLNYVKGVKILQDLTSFPSGHTMSAFAVYGFLALVFGKNPFLQILFITLALLVGVSRMYLLQHFLNDVLAGSFVGIYLAAFFYSFHLKTKKLNGFWERKINFNT